MKKQLSIIIPAYNEEQRIIKTLEKIYEFMNSKDFDFEVIVVDDGSKDKTADLVNLFGRGVKLIKQPKNMGKGAAVRRGILEAEGNWRLFSDADLSTPIYEIDKLLKSALEGYEVSIGSRAVDYSKIKKHQPFYREFMGKTFNKIVQMLVIKGIKDTQCGFKMFKAEAAIKVFSNSKIDGFGFDVEALYLAKKFNFKISEIPVEWYNDERSKVDPVRDSIRMFQEILKIKKLHG